METRLLITAATGVLGKAIVKAAAESKLSVRQGVRTLAKANADFESVRLDYSDASTITPALEGVSAIVLMAPPLDPNAPAELGPVIAAAKAANLQQIVLISAFGVNHNEYAPLRVVEHLVIDSGVPFTIVRPNFFMENFSEGFLASGIKEQNAIHLAAGDGKTSFVTVRDIATVVVAAVRNQLLGREIDLTGPAALDHTEVAKTIGETLGRQVAYHPLTEQQMLAGARSQGMPEPSVSYLSVLYGVVRGGLASGISGDFEAITGRTPTTFEQFARLSTAAWN